MYVCVCVCVYLLNCVCALFTLTDGPQLYTVIYSVANGTWSAKLQREDINTNKAKRTKINEQEQIQQKANVRKDR